MSKEQQHLLLAVDELAVCALIVDLENGKSFSGNVHLVAAGHYDRAAAQSAYLNEEEAARRAYGGGSGWRPDSLPAVLPSGLEQMQW